MNNTESSSLDMESEDLTRYLLVANGTDGIHVKVTKPHHNSNAIGIVSQNGRPLLVVKHRDAVESRVQALCYDIVKNVIAPSFTDLSPSMVAAPSFGIPNPELSDFEAGMVGYEVWTLKEKVWGELKAKIDEIPDDREDFVYRPSEYECWQLEEAAIYYDEPSKEVCPMSPRNVATLIQETLDESLKRKLRRAADRSSTGCLDLWDTLMLTEHTQQLIRTHEYWSKRYGNALWQGDEKDNALTQAETKLLLEEKLTGMAMEASVLFAALTAQPSLSPENLALREVHPPASSTESWSLAAVHIDTGTCPVNAGASLESLECLEDLHEGDAYESFTTAGELSSKGYYYPFPMLLPVANMPLSDKGLEGLQRVCGAELRRLVEKSFDESDENKLGRLGQVYEERLSCIQNLLAMNRNSTLREVCFAACPAWKRDFELARASETGDWFAELEAWAETNKSH